MGDIVTSARFLRENRIRLKWGRHTAIELRGKPDAPGVYASERLSHGEPGKIA